MVRRQLSTVQNLSQPSMDVVLQFLATTFVLYDGLVDFYPVGHEETFQPPVSAL